MCAVFLLSVVSLCAKQSGPSRRITCKRQSEWGGGGFLQPSGERVGMVLDLCLGGYQRQPPPPRIRIGL